MARVKILSNDREIAASFSIMQQLRPHLKEETYLQRIRNLEKKHEYRLVAVLTQNNIVALAGFRIAENLAWGKYLYIDDLITDEKNRKKGYAQMLFEWLVKKAIAQHCQELHLDSGVQRFDAHRFYLKNQMMIRSHHFVMELN